MVAIKGMELQTDCQKCPLMATDGTDELNPMMCVALWATKHEVRYCIGGKIRDDCPLTEIVTCKDCSIGGRECSNSGKYCLHIGEITEDDFYCKDGERRE